MYFSPHNPEAEELLMQLSAVCEPRRRWKKVGLQGQKKVGLQGQPHISFVYGDCSDAKAQVRAMATPKGPGKGLTLRVTSASHCKPWVANADPPAQHFLLYLSRQAVANSKHDGRMSPELVREICEARRAPRELALSLICVYEADHRFGILERKEINGCVPTSASL